MKSLLVYSMLLGGCLGESAMRIIADGVPISEAELNGIVIEQDRAANPDQADLMTYHTLSPSDYEDGTFKLHDGEDDEYDAEGKKKPKPSPAPCRGCGYRIPWQYTKCTWDIRPKEEMDFLKEEISKWNAAGNKVPFVAHTAFQANETIFMMCNCSSGEGQDIPDDQMWEFGLLLDNKCEGAANAGGWTWSKKWAKGYSWTSQAAYKGLKFKCPCYNFRPW
ncbi:hypothetical protein BX600DRAFT_505325 [Xylariales sp. PMI_506]|nr:hypothetical protein BX600DRAFT_505325 [Xylariales sp. PMI_506]